MANEKLIVTTSDGTDIPVIMAPPGHGAGAAVIIPNLPAKGGVSASRKRGYTKPSPWPSK
jgi:hypothetical protein